MSKTIMITGGARSGKSRIAEEQTLILSRPAIYIATAQAWDGEMRDRIALHKTRRDADWRTIEEPTNLITALINSEGQGARLVDCLTLWLTNLMLGDQDWRAKADELTDYLSQTRDPVVLVTNEVGMGIVPDTALGRAFRDAQGTLNQSVATVADDVYLAVSGLPLKVK